jgi:hypothetical protein
MNNLDRIKTRLTIYINENNQDELSNLEDAAYQIQAKDFPNEIKMPQSPPLESFLKRQKRNAIICIAEMKPKFVKLLQNMGIDFVLSRENRTGLYIDGDFFGNQQIIFRLSSS